MHVLLREWQQEFFAEVSLSICDNSRNDWECSPLATLHRVHGGFDVVVVLLDLLLKVFLSLRQVLKRFLQAFLLVQTLNSPTILAADIAGNRVEDPLVPIHTCDLSLLLQLEKEVDCMCLHLSERHTAEGQHNV